MKKILALIIAISMIFCLAACFGGGECEGCGKTTKNKIEVEGETGYICNDCCQEQFGMSFKELKDVIKLAEGLGY